MRYVPFFLASWPVWTRRTVARCIPVVVQRPNSHGLLFRRPLSFSCGSSTRWSMSLLYRPCRFLCIWLSLVRCSVFACGVLDYGFSWESLGNIVCNDTGGTAESPQLQLIDKVDELRGGFFQGPVHRYRAGGPVHRDTAPTIRCMCASLSVAVHRHGPVF